MILRLRYVRTANLDLCVIQLFDILSFLFQQPLKKLTIGFFSFI